MEEIRELYGLENKNITIPTPEEIQMATKVAKEKSEGVFRFEFSLEIKGVPAVIKMLGVRFNEDRFSIALTALYGKVQIPAGYFDFHISKYSERITAKGGGNFFARNMYQLIHERFFENTLSELYPDVRLNREEGFDSNNSLSILKKFRKLGIGETLFFTGLAICQAIGAEAFFVNDASYPSYKEDYHTKSYYARFLQLPEGGINVIFPLRANVQEKLEAHGMIIKK